MAALRANEEFNANAFPRRIILPIFSSYNKNKNIKTCRLSINGTIPWMRTDLSITIFLNDPDAYKGGSWYWKLHLENMNINCPRRCNSVPTLCTSREKNYQGRRLAAVTWIESMIPDPQKREILNDFGEVAKQSYKTMVL